MRIYAYTILLNHNIQRYQRSFVVALLLLAFIGKAQVQKPENVDKATMAKVFEKMNNWFKNTPAYSMKVTHASYENYTTTVPADRAVGYFKKDKNNYHSFLIGIHTIQNNDYKIVIDTAQKIMLVASPDQLVWNSYTTDNYIYLLQECSAIKVTTIGTDKKYRLEYKEGPLACYEIVVDADGLLKEVVSFYAKAIKKDENDKNSPKVKPRIVITFSGYEKKPVFNYKKDFDESCYFIKKGSKVIPVERYKKFKFSDQRLVTN